MESASLEKYEEKRLAALESYHILDTPCEKIFDNVTLLASKICDTPISLINLIGRDEQWTKSHFGIDVTTVARDQTICSHTILGTDILEISDTTQDKRFHDNPFVISHPNIRFYAGMPLTNPDGFRLGALCVIDKKPKTLTEDQKNQLRCLADIVTTLFEMKKKMLENAIEQESISSQLKVVNNMLEERLQEQKSLNTIITTFSEMNGMLQSCLTNEEAYFIISKFCQKTFPTASGTLYLANLTSRDFFESTISWNSPQTSEEIYANECWALRRGQSYYSDKTSEALVCDHFNQSKKKNGSLCIPLTAQGETIGILCLEEKFSETHCLLAIRMAEQIGLSLANIKLRQTMREQSICDPLTGLYNRRYLIEMFNRELPRAIKHNYQIGIIVVDIDHFKTFNDTYGHDAGDVVLKKIASLMKSHTHEKELVCRFGGEEFILLLRNVSLKTVRERAEMLRHDASGIQLEYGGKDLGKITLSLGVAIFPQHGESLEELITSADQALYHAKKKGRNQVIMRDRLQFK